MKKMFTVTKRCEVAIGHQLHLPYESPCNRCHGHNLIVLVTCKCEQLNDCNMVIDYKKIKETVMQFDHQFLNSHSEVKTDNPTSEWLANYLLEHIEHCVKVEVWESENNHAICELQG